MLHDTNFFVLRYQNFYIPYVLLENPNGKNYNLVVGTKKRMNRPGKFECNPDPSYSFEKCVRRSLANKIGCLSPWDPRPLGGDFKMCNLTSEVKRYLVTTFSLFSKVNTFLLNQVREVLRQDFLFHPKGGWGNNRLQNYIVCTSITPWTFQPCVKKFQFFTTMWKVAEYIVHTSITYNQ